MDGLPFENESACGEIMNVLRSRRRVVFAIIIAGALSAGAQIYFLHGSAWEPEEPYVIAQNIVAGKGYSYKAWAGVLHPTCFIPPGYVGVLLVLWKCGLSDKGVQISNVIVLILSAGLVYLIARLLRQSCEVSFLAFLAVAWYPPLWLLVGAPSPNALNIFLILVTCCQLLVMRNAPSFKNFAILGILLAAQLYIRPDVVIWVPLCAVWLWSVTRSNIKTGTFSVYCAGSVVIVCLLVAPWTVRNYEMFHKFIFISENGGANLWVGNNPDADGEFHPMDSPDGAYIMQKNAELALLDDYSKDSVFQTEAQQYIFSHPARTVKMFFVKAYYHWWMRPHAGETRGAGRFTEIYEWGYGIICIFSICGLVVLFKRGERSGASLILVVFVYSTLVSSIFFSQTRHRMIKAEPLMLMLCAVTVGSLLERRMMDSRGQVKPNHKSKEL